MSESAKEAKDAVVEAAQRVSNWYALGAPIRDFDYLMKRIDRKLARLAELEELEG